MKKTKLYIFSAFVVLVTLSAYSAVDGVQPDTGFFADTTMELGQKANEEGPVENGRYISSSKPNAENISGVWRVGDQLKEGATYLVNCKVKITDKETGAPGKGRVSVRFGNGVDLERIGPQRYTILGNKNISDEAEFSSYHVYDKRQPNFGIIAYNIDAKDRVEVYDVTMQETFTPWSVIPKKADKTFLINDVSVAGNSLREGSIPIPPGATQAHVKVTYVQLDIRSTAAVKAGVSHRGAKGFKPNKDIIAPKEYYFWRDGDDLDHWITFDIVNPSSRVGDRFRASLKGAGVAGWFGFDFEVVEGAVNALPDQMPYHRPPYELVLPETPTKDLDMTTVEWDETGFKDGKPVWVTHPAYIYTQPGNNETGVYLPWAKQNAAGVDPHSLEVDKEGRPYVLLHTRKLPEPVVVKNKSFPHQASMLQGQELDEWCYRRGIYSAQLVLPDRVGAWSAFWACGRHGPSKNPMWPPEVDFLESFNGAYGAPFHPDTTSAGQHAGLHGSVKRETIDGFELDLIDLGFSPELNFNTQIHDFTTVIEDAWITHFRDGIEFFRQRNILDPADGNTEWDFYPIVNVAVKDASGDDYDDGSGDMRWYGLQYYAPDSGYRLKPYTHPKPYPNREVLPRPRM